MGFCLSQSHTDSLVDLQELSAQDKGMGNRRAVAGFRGVIAVGYSNAVVGVLMPRGLSSEGHPSGSVNPVTSLVRFHTTECTLQRHQCSVA